MAHIHAASEDPTHTKSLRKSYAQALRGAFDKVNSALREGVVEEDRLGLSKGGELFAAEPPPDLSTVDEAVALDRFEEWINDAQESEVMDVIERDGNRYVERAYERGITDADRELSRAGVIDEPADAAAARQFMAMPVHEQKLQRLFSKNYAELDGITNAVSQQIVRELSDGVGQGLNPREMARNLTDRVDSIGKHRATTLARTEILSAHSSATIERYRQQGVEEVGLEPEVQIQTATDQRVCQQCAEAAQLGPWELDEFEGSEHQPPLHPNCRCAVVAIMD